MTMTGVRAAKEGMSRRLLSRKFVLTSSQRSGLHHEVYWEPKVLARQMVPAGRIKKLHPTGKDKKSYGTKRERATQRQILQRQSR